MRLVFLFCVFCLLLNGCSNEPVEINWGTDQCAHCGMIIADKHFAAQFISSKGKPYLFDAIECLAAWQRQENSAVKGSAFVKQYTTETWIAAEQAVFVQSAEMRSPMGLNAGAFQKSTDYGAYTKGEHKILSYNEILSYAGLR